MDLGRDLVIAASITAGTSAGAIRGRGGDAVLMALGARPGVPFARPASGSSLRRLSRSLGHPDGWSLGASLGAGGWDTDAQTESVPSHGATCPYPDNKCKYQ